MLNKILHLVAVLAGAPAVLGAVDVFHLPPFVGLLLGGIAGAAAYFAKGPVNHP
jgi:hypothetical protein